MMEEILRHGVALAHRRARLVLWDVFWKTLWLVFSAGAVLLVLAWYGARVQSLSWEDTGILPVNGLIATVLAREFWNANKFEILAVFAAVVLASMIAWLLLESHFRRKFVVLPSPLPPGEGVGRPRLSSFLISRILKSVVLGSGAILLSIVFFHGAPLLAAFIFLSLAFCLSVIETLIRAGAVELAGTDLIRVTGLLGILMSFELTIAVSLGLLLFAGFLNVGRLMDALVMLGTAGLVVVFLTVLHSYLLLVRYSAIAVMRQNAVEI
jgi:hypothetical protein